MSSDLKAANDRVEIPAVLAIGFTGHRMLVDETASGKIIHDFLLDKKHGTSEMLLGISSVAAGGDLLFAENCLALDIPLRVLLPLTQDEFRNEFDSVTWTRVQKVMSRALSVEITGSEGEPDERYYECGLATVLQSQLQIALWDGQTARGLGGTEQIVSFAREIGRPLVWIHSVTGAIEYKAGKKRSLLDSDEELKFLNRLETVCPAVGDNSLADMSAAWLAKLDANAAKVAPQVRRLAALPIICTALAALMSGGASRAHPSRVWIAVGAALGLTATLLPVALKLGRRQALWVRIRTAAEVSRSILALWETPLPYEVVGPEILPELCGMIMSLNFLKSKTSNGTARDVDSFKSKYLKERLLDQRQYFFRQSSDAALKGNRYRLVSKIGVVSAIVISIWTFTNGFLLRGGRVASWNLWLPLFAAVLFQVATIAGALLIVNDCDRRQRRYREIYDSLANWESELKAFRTWPPVVEVVNRIERARRVELLEWRSLLQNTKMPRN